MRSFSLNILAHDTVWIHQKSKDENGLPLKVIMPSQKEEKHYSVQKWIHNLLLKLPPQDNHRIKYLKHSLFIIINKERGRVFF